MQSTCYHDHLKVSRTLILLWLDGSWTFGRHSLQAKHFCHVMPYLRQSRSMAALGTEAKSQAYLSAQGQATSSVSTCLDGWGHLGHKRSFLPQCLRHGQCARSSHIAWVERVMLLYQLYLQYTMLFVSIFIYSVPLVPLGRLFWYF